MTHPGPVFLFTDFGLAGPYVGQMTGAILGQDPRLAVINLMHDAPAMRPDLSAYLLAACCSALPSGSVVAAVVDPGVGGERAALVVETPSLTAVGPDNGLLSRLPGITRVQVIDWRPAAMSSSFHGRDLFAPVAAMLAVGDFPAATAIVPGAMVGADWPGEVRQVVYIDAFGNLMIGIDAGNLSKNRHIRVPGHLIGHAETFCRAPPGGLFWYRNSQGLVEIAANRGSAADALGLALGDKILLD
ncbi:MAG: SAM-dependent chlorinase/fluorinase [Sedimenticolaceae bacterium]